MRRTILAAALVAGALVAPVPRAAEAERPTVTVTPNTNLVDDQPLRISIAGWEPNQFLVALLCPAGGPAWGGGCDYVTRLIPGPQGNLRVRRPADVILDRSEGGPIDCRVTACELRVRDANGPHGVPNNAVVRVPLQFDPSGPDPARPATTVDPNQNLVDGDVVRVEGHGFPIPAHAPTEGGDGPARPVYLYECRADPTSYRDCHRQPTVAGMTPTGDFGRQVTIRSRLYTGTGASIDCLAEPCVVAASNGAGFSEAGIVLLDLDPTGPVAPAPTVTVTPGTDLADGEVVQIRATHFEPNITVTLALCPPDVTGNDFLVCHDADHRDTNIDGVATFRHAVHARFQPFHGPAVDCRDVTCSFVVTWFSDVDEAPRGELALDPDAPLVDPDLTAHPIRNLATGDRIAVTGEGYLRTNWVRLTQCVVVTHPVQWYRACDGNSQIARLRNTDPISFSASMPARRRMWTDLGRIDCARRTCYVATYDEENGLVRGPRLRFSP